MPETSVYVAFEDIVSCEPYGGVVRDRAIRIKYRGFDKADRPADLEIKMRFDSKDARDLCLDQIGRVWK